MSMRFRDEMNHPVLQKHINIIKELDDDRVMCVCYDDEKDRFFIIECCDEWYYRDLTKEDCIALSKLFHDIALAIPNTNTQNINLIPEVENGLQDFPVTKEENINSKWWLRKPPEPNSFVGN